MLYRSAWFGIDHPLTLHFAADHHREDRDLFAYIHPTDLPAFLRSDHPRVRKVKTWEDLIGRAEFVNSPSSSIFAASHRIYQTRRQMFARAIREPSLKGISFTLPDFVLYDEDRHSAFVRGHLLDLFRLAKDGDKSLLIVFHPPAVGVFPIGLSLWFAPPGVIGGTRFYPKLDSPIPCIGVPFLVELFRRWMDGHIDEIPRRAVLYLPPHFSVSPEQTAAGSGNGVCLKAVPLWWFSLAAVFAPSAFWAYRYLNALRRFLKRTDRPSTALVADADVLIDEGFCAFDRRAFTPLNLPEGEDEASVRMKLAEVWRLALGGER